MSVALKSIYETDVKDLPRIANFGLPEWAKEERANKIRLMDQARDAREASHTEFHGLSYSKRYEKNMKASLSYPEPVRNKNEDRVVNGATEDKINTMTSFILSFNYQNRVETYYEDVEQAQELAMSFEDSIRKAKELDDDFTEKESLIIREGITQGEAIVEYIMEQKWERVKKLKNIDFLRGSFMKETWVTEKQPGDKQLTINLIPGVNFYPGNVATFHMNKQPYLFTRSIENYTDAELQYGEWEMFKYVCRDLDMIDDTDFYIEYLNKFNNEDIKKGKVEILKYQSTADNSYQIFINGVPMLPVGFPLSYLTGRNKYTYVKFSTYPISEFFFYCRGVADKTRQDQAILDEMYRIMIKSWRLSVDPPLANNTGSVLTRHVFDPASITDNVDPSQIGKLWDTGGFTQAQFAMMQFVSQTIDNKSVSPTFQGQAMRGEQTANEINTLQKQSFMRLGVLMTGVLAFYQDLGYLMLDTILKHWVEDQKRIPIETTFGDGDSGTRILQFTTDVPPQSILDARAYLMENKTGKKIRETYINKKLLGNLRYGWRVRVEPEEKETDALKKVMFRQDVMEAAKLFGLSNQGGALNIEFVKDKWAKSAKWNKSRAFVPNIAQPMTDQMQNNPTGQALQQSANPKTQLPSINTLKNANVRA